ncbi:MAG: amidohydrolase [Candidatus Latescibacterota bacterium]
MTRTIFTNGYLFSREGTFAKSSLIVDGPRIAGVSTGGTPAPGSRDGIEAIDVGSRYLLPGFVDAHFHIRSLALKSLRCDLGGSASAAEALDRLRNWPGREDAHVLVGVDWDESQWPERRYPTLTMLDKLESKRPVFMRRICGHIGVVNTPFADMLQAQGVPVDRQTGVIEEDAVWSAGRFSSPDDAALVQSFDGAIAELHRLGITAVHDIIEANQFDLYLEGVRRARHPIRIKGYIPTAPANLAQYREEAGSMDSEFFEIKGVKIFLDGSIGGWTAALNEPYNDSPRRGDLLFTGDKLRQYLDACYEHNDDCAVHAIGDRAVRTLLHHLAAYPKDARCFRIEHAEILGPEEMALLEQSPVYLAVQPNFIRNWGSPAGLYEARLGKERLTWCNRFKTLFDKNVAYCFSSDGMPAGPLYGLKGATHHPVPEERIPAGEALLRYTARAHELSGSTKGHGYLEAGSPADFIVLSGNPLEEDSDDISIMRTFIAGKCVYTADHG